MEKESKKNPELDLAPLSLAHEHARCASVATKTNNVPLARDQHVLAAGEFAKAAESAASLEALRTLKLLEDHHKHMSELIKDLPNPNKKQKKTGEEVLEVIAEKDTQQPSAAVAKLQSDERKTGEKSDSVQLSSTRRSPSKPNSQPRRPPSRELSSSIASNLATARGIRASHARLPVSPSVSTQHAPGSFEQPMRRDRHGNRIPSVPASQPGKPSWVPPTNHSPKQAEAASNPYTRKKEGMSEEVAPKTKTAGDLGFERFYGMAEALMNKISAPLAYAGLPLNIAAEDPTPKPESEDSKLESNRKRSDTQPANEPDLTKYISKAALRALGGGRDLVNDSFYVVPSTGLTTSYAGIMRHAAKEKRREDESHVGASDGIEKTNNEDEDGEEDDDFVDARETFSPSYRASMNAQNSLANNVRKRFSRGGGGNILRQQQQESDAATAGRNGSSNRLGGGGGNNDAAAAAAAAAGRNKSEKILIEELEIKNEELRRVVDTLTKRLYVFETSAQRSSLALHESIRFLGAASNSPVASVLSGGGGGGAATISRTSSPVTPGGTTAPVPGRGDRTIVEDVLVDAIRMKEMERRIGELEGERDGLGREVVRERREGERLRETVRKYREKWEVLKKGAKERRMGGGGGGSGAAIGAGSGDGGGSSVGIGTGTTITTTTPTPNVIGDDGKGGVLEERRDGDKERSKAALAAEVKKRNESVVADNSKAGDRGEIQGRFLAG